MSRTTEQQTALFAKVNDAVQIMSKSTSVQDWNERRNMVKREFIGNQRDFMDLWYTIDASGLIILILGKDTIRTYHHNSNYGVSPAKESEML